MTCKDLAMHRVVVLALEGVYPFELSIPVRIFGTATGDDGESLYEVVHLQHRRRPGDHQR